MEFITGVCPKCQGELQIPKGHEQIICMYCGVKIDTKAAMMRKEAGQSKEEPRQPGKKTAGQNPGCLQEAKRRFPEMLFSIQDPLKNFKKSMYESGFRAYEAQHEKVMDLLEDACMETQDLEGTLKELASAMVEEVLVYLDRKKNKRQQEEAMVNFNMSLVIYVNPALIDHSKAFGKALAEALLAEWKEHFPKTNLKISDFESINGGFKRRFCYITTAVCESLGKPDDCYELNLLREYRDTYLVHQPKGEALIQRYYDIAPTIVKRIEKEKNARKIYREIWKDYLLPCIKLIEEDKKEECQALYQEMMHTLTQKYFYQEELAS